MQRQRRRCGARCTRDHLTRVTVSVAGYAWHTTYLAPSLWTDPSPPVTAVEALLPPLGSDGRSVECREVLLDSPEVRTSTTAPLPRVQLLSHVLVMRS